MNYAFAEHLNMLTILLLFKQTPSIYVDLTDQNTFCKQFSSNSKSIKQTFLNEF